MNLIDPPTANNMGDARLSHDLEVPSGRARAEPVTPVVTLVRRLLAALVLARHPGETGSY